MNKFYIGKLLYGKQENNLDTNTYKRSKEFKYEFNGRHVPIIDLEIFETVQNLIAKRRITKSNGLLFSGILKCHCGGKMYKSMTRGYTDYKCNVCAKSISTVKVEDFILRKITKMTELEKLNKEKSSDKIIILQGKINGLNKKISNFKEEKSKLISLLTKELITEDEFSISKKRIDDRIRLEYINKEKYESIIDFEEKKDNQKDNLDILRSVINSIKDDDIDELNDIFRMLIREIILISKDPLKLEITLNI